MRNDTTETKEFAPIENLSKDILREIVLLLGPEAVLNLRKASKVLSGGIDQTKIWQVLFEKLISQYVKPSGNETYKQSFLKHYPNVVKIAKAFEVNKQNVLYRWYKRATTNILNPYDAFCMILAGGYEIVLQHILLPLNISSLENIDQRLTASHLTVLILQSNHAHFFAADFCDQLFRPDFKTVFSDPSLTAEFISNLLKQLPTEKQSNLVIFLNALTEKNDNEYLHTLWSMLIIRAPKVLTVLPTFFAEFSADNQFKILLECCNAISKHIMIMHETSVKREKEIADLQKKLSETQDDAYRDSLRNNITSIENELKFLSQNKYNENYMQKFSALLAISKKDVFKKINDFTGETLFLKALGLPPYHALHGPAKVRNGKTFLRSEVPTKYKDYYKKILTELVNHSKPLPIFDIPNKFGYPPLHYVLESLVFEEARDFFIFFLDLQPNLDLQDKKGRTALHLCAEKLTYNFAWQELVKRGANLNIKDHEGNTPLHKAILEKNLPFAKFLLENGANVTIRSTKNGTPLELVMQVEQSFANDPKLRSSWQKFRETLQESLQDLQSLEPTNQLSEEKTDAEFSTETVKNVQFWLEEKNSLENQSTDLANDDKSKIINSSEYFGPSNN